MKFHDTYKVIFLTKTLPDPSGKHPRDDEIRQERRAEARLPFPPNKYFYRILNAYFLMQRTAAGVFGA